MSGKVIYNPQTITATNTFNAGTKINIPAFEGTTARHKKVSFRLRNTSGNDACLVPRDPAPLLVNPEDFLLPIPANSTVVYEDWALQGSMDWHVMRASTAVGNATVKVVVMTSQDMEAR